MKINRSLVVKATAHIKHFLKKSYQDNVSALAGQSAFFILLSAVPLMMFAFSLYSLLTGKQFSYDDLPKVNTEINTVARYIVTFIERSMQRASTGKVIVTAVITLWSAGKGMYCITEGIARIYRLPNKHIWLFKRVFSMGYTVVTLLIFLLCIGAAALDVLFAQTLTRALGLDSTFHYLLYLLLYFFIGLLQAFLMTFALKLYLRRKTDDHRYLTMRALLPGMLLTVLAWNVLSIGVMIYLRHFAVSSLYGSLASVIVIMVWIYFMMYLLLYGVQLNYIYRREFAQLSLKKLLRRQR